MQIFPHKLLWGFWWKLPLLYELLCLLSSLAKNVCEFIRLSVSPAEIIPLQMNVCFFFFLLTDEKTDNKSAVIFPFDEPGCYEKEYFS